MAKLVCQHCGLTAPQGHPDPERYIKQHEANCPKHPNHNK